MAPISAIAAIAPIVLPTAVVPAAAVEASGFPHVFQAAIQNVENAAAAANSAVQNYMSGGTQELHSTILATQAAELDLEMFLQVRNKVVSAYEEVMKLQI
jgi:flagellar hook-basal body complex protein FliE